MRIFLAALWYAVSITGLGVLGSYLVLTVALDALPAWLTLGGSALVGVGSGLYYFFTELEEDRRYRAKSAKEVERARQRYFT